MADDNKIVTKKTTTRKTAAVPVTPKNPAIPTPATTSAQEVKTTPAAKSPAPVRKTPARPAATSGNAATRPVPAVSTAKASAANAAPAPKATAPVAAKATTATSPRARKPAAAASSPAPKPTPARSKTLTPPTLVDAENREAMIREAAYYLAEKHGFDSSFDSLNWEEATQQIDALLARRGQD